MKLPKLYFSIVIFILLQLSVFAQVQVDHSLQFTGNGANARVSGIHAVVDSADAPNVAAIQNGSLIYAVATGSGNSFNISISPPIAAYQAGMVFNFISNQTITGPATLNVNSLGTVPLKIYISQNVTGCEIQNRQVVTVIYDGTNFQMTSLPAPPATPAAPVATAGSNILTNQITANWNSSGSANGYQLDVSTANNFSSLLATYTTADTAYTISGLSPVTTYYYRVRALNNCGGVSGNSDTIMVTTGFNIDSIVHYWTMDGNSLDTVGSENGADMNITYSYANGKINQGAGFNGSSSGITLNNVVSGQVNLTLAAWIKTSVNSSSQQYIICQRDNDYNGEFAFYVASGQLGFFDYTISGGNGFTGNSTFSGLADGNWHFVVFTKNGTTGTFYVDGASAGVITSTYSVTYDTQTGGIGYDRRGDDAWFDGDIDEVSVWTRPLSAAEITALYNNGAGLQYPF